MPPGYGAKGVDSHPGSHTCLLHLLESIGRYYWAQNAKTFVRGRYCRRAGAPSPTSARHYLLRSVNVLHIISCPSRRWVWSVVILPLCPPHPRALSPINPHPCVTSHTIRACFNLLPTSLIYAHLLVHEREASNRYSAPVHPLLGNQE